MRRSLVALLLLPALFGFHPPVATDARFASLLVDPASSSITMHWKDANGQRFGSIGRMKDHLAAQHKQALVIMNGGMYMEDRAPLGLYVENGTTLRKLNTREKAEGNFYLQPNGVFGMGHDGKAFVCTTPAFARQAGVKYATQSGPLLLSNGAINTHFTKGSTNLNVRNGVGRRSDGKLVFAISREAVNFHDFATFFLQQGCTDALYFDGFVSRAYMPSADMRQLDGDFGVMVAVSRN